MLIFLHRSSTQIRRLSVRALDLLDEEEHVISMRSARAADAGRWIPQSTLLPTPTVGTRRSRMNRG